MYGNEVTCHEAKSVHQPRNATAAHVNKRAHGLPVQRDTHRTVRHYSLCVALWPFLLPTCGRDGRKRRRVSWRAAGLHACNRRLVHLPVTAFCLFSGGVGRTLDIHRCKLRACQSSLKTGWRAAHMHSPRHQGEAAQIHDSSGSHGTT